MKNVIKRELYIIKHAQTAKFRGIKWLVIIVITALIYFWRSWTGVGIWIATGFVLGISFHFWLRAKTRGWTHP